MRRPIHGGAHPSRCSGAGEASADETRMSHPIPAPGRHPPGRGIRQRHDEAERSEARKRRSDGVFAEVGRARGGSPARVNSSAALPPGDGGGNGKDALFEPRHTRSASAGRGRFAGERTAGRGNDHP